MVVPPKDTFTNVVKTASENQSLLLLLSLMDQLDISNSRDPCGFLHAENKNLSSLAPELLKALIELAINFLLQENPPNQNLAAALDKLVSFVSRMLYLDPEDSTPPLDELGKYSIHHTVALYLPHSQKHLLTLGNPSEYNFRVPAIVQVILEHKIAKKEKGRRRKEKLVIGVMPVLYIYYPDHPQYNGVSLDEVREDIAKRNRNKTGGGPPEAIKFMESLKVHAQEPFFFIHFYPQDQDSPFIIKGIFGYRQGQFGINLYIPQEQPLTGATGPKFSIYAPSDKLTNQQALAFLPLNLPTIIKQFERYVLKHLAKSPGQKQIMLLAHILLGLRFKTTPELEKLF